jgi:hypothetical protein
MSQVSREAPFLVIRQVFIPFQAYRGIHDVEVGRITEWGVKLIEKREMVK